MRLWSINLNQHEMAPVMQLPLIWCQHKWEIYQKQPQTKRENRHFFVRWDHKAQKTWLCCGRNGGVDKQCGGVFSAAHCSWIKVHHWLGHIEPQWHYKLQNNVQENHAKPRLSLDKVIAMSEQFYRKLGEVFCQIKTDPKCGLQVRLLVCSRRDLECPCKIYDLMRSQVIPGEMLPSNGKQMQLTALFLLKKAAFGCFTFTALLYIFVSPCECFALNLLKIFFSYS